MLCKYGENVGRIIVAGYPADWLSDEVVKLEVPDQYTRKHLNLMNCIKAVVDRELVSGEFLYSSDDHFYTKPTDFDNYPFYAKCLKLRNFAVKKTKGYSYHLSLMQTRALLEKHGLPIVNFEEHCNTHMHTQVFKDFPDLISDSMLLSRGAAPTSLIMNAWITTAYAPKDVIQRADIKVRGCETVEDLRAQMKGSECFSIGDSVFANGVLEEYFKQEVPNPCKYEKG